MQNGHSRYEDSDDDEEGLKGPSGSFEKLDSSLHYSLTQNGTEIIPTDYVLANQNLSKSMITYGGPTSSISTLHVIGRKINKKHHQYDLSAGMILGVREVVGGVQSLYDEEESDQDENDDETSDDEEEEDDVEDTDADVNHDKDNIKSAEKQDIDTKPSSRIDEDKDNNMISTSPTRVKLHRLREQCSHFEKYNFPAGSYIISGTKALPYRYKFKAYAPRVFSKIRNFFGVGKQDFLHSICGRGAFIEFMSNAKSGQFFFYSHDGRYMIKTQTNAESTMLRSILPDYVNYMFENPHSFLTHFYGMYRVMMPDLDHKLHFVIMKSVFNTEKEIHKIYDLKGSKVGRRAKRGDSVHKDLDILDEGWKIRVGQPVKKAMMDQLRRDTEFLVRLRIMDYSLLLGLHVHSSDTDNTPQEEAVVDLSSPTKLHRSEILRSNTPVTRKLSLLDISVDSGLTLNLDGDVNTGQDENKVSEDRLNPSPDQHDDLPYDEAGVHYTQCRDAASRFDESDDDTNSPPSSIDIMNSIPSKDMLLMSDKRTEDSAASEQTMSRTVTVPAETADEPEKFLDSFKRCEPYQGNPFTSREDCGIPSHSGDGKSSSREIYFIGIIDILQYYTTRKWGETMVKKVAGNSEADISCVDPVTYANRFIDFMDTLIE